MKDQFISFGKNFFKNAKADSVSSAKGLVQLVGAAGICYGMSTGAVPINEMSTGTAATLFTSGIHSLGSGPTK